VAQQPVSLMVPLSAVQTAGETEVVYVKSGATYTQRPVRLGQRDATRVEVQSGLKTGEQVVTAQSFLIKADIEKSTAEHDH
jgi:cobalt-zinc-cadmium efflux system membrane fusion protein